MTNTLERYDHHEDGMEIARDGDFVFYDDYTALLSRAEQAEARERALLEGNEINRKTLLKHNADNAAQIATLKARVAELEKACAEWAEVSQSNYQRAKRAEARVKELEAEREEDHKNINIKAGEPKP
jgi:hypothetical protein